MQQRADYGDLLTCVRPSCKGRHHEACLRWWQLESNTAAQDACPACPPPGECTPKRKISAPARVATCRTPSTVNTTLSSSSELQLYDFRDEVWAGLECGGPPEEIPLPQTEPLSGKHWSAANAWIGVLGRDLVTCLLSREWNIRETALRRLAREVANHLKAAHFSSESVTERADRLWKTAADVLAKAVEDKVFKVYLSAVRCLRTLLVFTRVRDEAHEQALLSALRPILQGILLKCADGNRRLAELSAEIVEEVCRGEVGAMPLGRLGGGTGFGLDFVLQNILEDRDPHKVSWQFFLGRLTILQRLLKDFTPEFSLASCRDNSKRLTRVAEYSAGLLLSSHVNVSKLSRSIFIRCACLASSEPAVFSQLWQMLSSVDQTLQLRMKRKIKAGVKDLPGSREVYFQLDKMMFEEPPLHGSRPSLNRSTSHSPSRQWTTAAASAEQQRGQSQSPSRILKAKRVANITALKRTKYRMKQKLKSVCREVSPDLLPPPPSELASMGVDMASVHPQEGQAATRQQQSLAAFSSSSPSLTSGDWLMESKLQTPDLPPLRPPFFPDTCYREGVDWTRGLLLGTGAFSSCYQGRDVRTGSLMAVKQITLTRTADPAERAKLADMMRDEVGILSGLDHPHVLRLFGVTAEDTHVNVFVEWMPGGSVAALLDRHGAFTEMVMLRYLVQALLALEYLHNLGVLHRDLKGANLLVDSTGHHLRVGDFGAAARMASFASIPGEFKGQLQGTIAFMAPEVLRGESYGRSCDVWSLGCCVIEMATTRPPWNNTDISNHLALIFRIAGSPEAPHVPDSLSPGLRDFTLHCLELRPEQRPSAAQLLTHPVLAGF